MFKATASCKRSTNDFPQARNHQHSCLLLLFLSKKSKTFGLLATVVGKGSSTPTLQGSYITLQSNILENGGFDFHNSSSSSAVPEWMAEDAPVPWIGRLSPGRQYTVLAGFCMEKSHCECRSSYSPKSMILSLAALSGDAGLANVAFRRAFIETSQVPLLHGRTVIKNKRT